MLSKKVKRILKLLTKNHYVNDLIDTRDLYGKIDISADEINSICDFLNSEGLFSDYVELLNGGRSFVLTYKTFAYKSEKHTELARFILSSIVVPIIVGVLSSILSNVIINYL